MPDTQNMTKDTTNNIWPYDIEISSSGWTQTHTFQTQNKFLDANIAVRAHTNAAGALTLALTDITTGLSMGSASGGKYSPTVQASGTVTPASAGWITATAVNVTDNSFAIGTINQSILKNGTTTINSGATVNPAASSQTINISEGYNTARTVIIGPVSAGPKGTIKSGTASLGTLTYAYNSDNTNFTITGTASITAPTVPTAGYVSSDANASVGGTKQTNSNTVTQSVDVVTVGSVQDGTFTKAKPVLTRTAKNSGSWVDAAKGSETSGTTANKPYVQVDAAAVDAYLKTKGSVTADGYGTTSVFNTASSLSTNVGTQVADTIYIPIKEATIKSPDTTATIGNPTHQSSGTNANKFTISVTGTIAVPTVSAEGYINNTTNIGTKQTGSISGTKVLNKVTVGATITDGSSGTVTPVISRTAKPTDDTWTDAASGAATDTKPTSGPYVQVNAPAITKNISVNGTVTGEGYGTTSLYNQAATALSITAGSAAAVTKYIPITSASGYRLNVTSISGSSDVTIGTLNTTTNKYPIKASNVSVTGTLSASTNGWFSSGSATDSDTDNVTIGNMNKATFTVNGRTVYCNGAGYVPEGSTSSYVGQIPTGTISAVSTDPGSSYTNNTSLVLESGGWLRLTAGYYSATRISLATLVPDGSNIKGHSEYLLVGKTAYDNDGTLVTGTIETYKGEYTIA